MSVPPTGTVTFLFTDIEGSTKVWERNPRLCTQPSSATMRTLITPWRPTAPRLRRSLGSGRRGASMAARSKPEAELKGVKDQLLSLATRVLASDLDRADATMVAQVRNVKVWVELRGARAGARVPRLGGPGVHEA
jgi:class 3 adenylate cyclase